SCTPYFAVPIWNTMSQLPSRCQGARAPSPVLSQQPAMLAPLDRALMAGLEIAPKLMPEILKKEEVVYGCAQNGPNRISRCSIAAVSKAGKGELRKRMLPGRLLSLV